MKKQNIIYIYYYIYIQVDSSFLLGVPCGRFLDCPEWSPQEHPIELTKAESSDFGVSHFVCLGMFPLKKSRFFGKRVGDIGMILKEPCFFFFLPRFCCNFR